jgi:hypothetical protein
MASGVMMTKGCRSGRASGERPTDQNVPMASVLISPLPTIGNTAQAIGDVTAYLTSYTGRYFEPLAGMADPDRFEASDLVAVSCLSVNVPAETAGWLLVGEGRHRSAELLAAMKVSVNETLRDHDLAANDAAVALWNLLRSRRGLGPTTVSKLLAAKRPHLVPIYDAYVAAVLLPSRHRRQRPWWEPWRSMLIGPQGPEIDAALRTIRNEVHKARPELPIDAVSDLRLLDIIVWMAEDRRRRTP